MSTTAVQSVVPSESAQAALHPENLQLESFKPVSDLWVSLRNAPSEFSDDEALLLCETFPGEWAAWVHGYGEITLSRGQFHQTEQA